MARAYRYVFVMIMVAVVTTFASAQVWEIGKPKFGSFGGGPVDIIDLGNLNAHFTVPVLHKAGRGIPFNFDLTYDTTFWYPAVSGSTTFWNPITTGGWSGSALNVGVLGYSETVDGYGDISICNIVYYDGFGTGHPFAGCALWDNIDGIDYPLVSVAADDSGYTVSADAFYGSFQLTSAEGDYIIPQATVPLNPQVVPGSVIDRNGNEVNVDKSGHYTDTLGTTALTAAGGNPNPYTLTYTSPAGTPAAVTVTFKAYTVKTNFGCSGIVEYPATTAHLVDRVTLPDGSYYQFTYEPTPGFTGDVTGRLASIRVPAGGTISYAYTGGHNGIFCSDGSTSGFTRTTPDGVWTYSRVQGTGTASTTTIKDPTGNYTVVQFQGIYETQRQVYQGAISTANLLQTSNTCYNGSASPCTGTAITLPITQRSVITQLGSSGLQAKSVSLFNSYGLPTEMDNYDYGPTAPGALLRKTIYTYPSNLGNIKAFYATVTTQDGGGHTLAQNTYNYDETAVVATTGTPQHVSVGSASRGNLTSIVTLTQGSTTQRRTNTYYDTGNMYVSSDVNGMLTTRTYNSASCGNSFPTSITTGSLTVTPAWNCTGGVITSLTDPNGKSESILYNDHYFWRPASYTDKGGNVKTITYPTTNSAESVLNFNSGLSTVDMLTTFDSLGRRILSQRREAPGSATFDSQEFEFDTDGRPSKTTATYSASAGGTNSSGPGTSVTYDALNRPLQTADPNAGTVSVAYSNNDVYRTLLPAPTGENAKGKQLQYDALGRLTSVCEVTSSTGSGTCSQTATKTGYYTTYAYGIAPNYNSVSVTQNAQSTSKQTRSYIFDLKGRLTQETNPEAGTTTYTYDTSTTCGTSQGDLVQKKDAIANTTCYIHDNLHRVTSVTYSGSYASKTPNRYFVYDAATVNGLAMANVKGRLAEAFTATCSTCTKITDMGYSYNALGQVSDLYESTPNSKGYYHVNTLYWPNGAVEQLSGIPSLPTITYTPDGEGRWKTVSASSGQNPVTASAYSVASEVTSVTYGSGDSDSFGYGPSGRMTSYSFDVNGQNVTGTLTWNPNGTLGKIAIVDPFSTTDTQTCAYTHDDLVRLASVNCGSVWTQTFTYDAFGNISKSGTSSFQPTYSSASNRMTALPGFTPTYDANGNLTADSIHTYSWDVEGRPTTIDTVTTTYDAFGRMVEKAVGGAFTQIVYGPTGAKLAYMNGQTLTKALIRLPGRGQAVYTASGLSYYRRSDWLGSVRISSTPTRTVKNRAAYGPFGETYAQSGTDVSFTGQEQDTVSGLYDFPERRYSPVQGRWVSPDPAGGVATRATNPQSWNRYNYALNNPLRITDPTGLDDCSDFGICDWGGGDGWGDGGGDGGQQQGNPPPPPPIIEVCLSYPPQPGCDGPVNTGNGGGGTAPSDPNDPSSDPNNYPGGDPNNFPDAGVPGVPAPTDPLSLGGIILDPSQWGYYNWWSGTQFHEAFYDAFGVAENEVKLVSEFGNTVPDLLATTEDGALAAIGEIKSSLFVGDWGNVAVQLDIAAEEGVPYYLFVSPGTTVFSTVTTAAAETGGGVFVVDAAAGTIAEYATGAILTDEAVDLLLLLFLL